MRLAGQIKGGYYPCPPEAVDLVLSRLRRPAEGPCTIVDPCAGEGNALLRLAQGLSGEPFAIELAEDRAQILREKVPEKNCLAPASFFGCAISPKWASLAFVNPPFDHATGGGGRVELDFVQRCVPILAPHGVLVLVCPEDVAQDYRTMRLLAQQFDAETMSAVPFPQEVREYDEVMVFCRKKDKPSQSNDWGLYERIKSREVVYELPAGRRPLRWRKDELTPTEIIKALKTSPVRWLLEPPKELPLPRPPITPGQGHRAMLLASGFIDGLIQPENEPPHVVKGTVTKERYVKEITEQENDDGSLTTKRVESERIKLVVRALDHEGTLHTLLQE